MIFVILAILAIIFAPILSEFFFYIELFFKKF